MLHEIKLLVNNKIVSIKFSTLWESGIYKFQQIRSSGYDYLLCFGLSPNEAHCYMFEREYILQHSKKQHKGAEGAESWISINPYALPKWAKNRGDTIEKAIPILRKYLK